MVCSSVHVPNTVPVVRSASESHSVPVRVWNPHETGMSESQVSFVVVRVRLGLSLA